MITIQIRNISKLAAISNYEYSVYTIHGNTGSRRVIAKGTISKHARKDGWRKLVDRVCKEAIDIDEQDELDKLGNEVIARLIAGKRVKSS